MTPLNAQELVKQWTDVHGLSPDSAEQDKVDGYPRRVWRGPRGEALVEEYTITDMAHGTPLAPGSSDAPHGAAGPFLLDVGIASSYHIAKFWGLTTAAAGHRLVGVPAVEGGSKADARSHRKASETEAVPASRERPSTAASPPAGR